MGLEYIYGALLLHELGKEITEESLEKVIASAGIEPNKAMVKATVENLKEVNIEEAIKSVSIAQVAPAPSAPQPEEKPEEKKEEKKEDKEKKAEEAAAGLSALFG